MLSISDGSANAKSLPVPRLNPAYDGPVVIATVDGTLIDKSDPGCSHGNSGGPMYGASKLLSQVEAQGVPVIYLAADASEVAALPPGTVVTPDKLQSLREQMPQAQFYGLGNDAGSDAALFIQNGVRPYLLNTEATQKNIPAGFHGILNDNFTPQFNDRLVADLQAAKAHQPPAPESTWVAPPPIPHVSSLGRTLANLKVDLGYVGGAPFYLAGRSLEALFHKEPKPPTLTRGDWSGFETFMDRNTGTQSRPGSKVEPLIDGSEGFPAMYKAIDAAKSSVNYTVFDFSSDETGWEMARHLAAAADRGCTVRLLYDHTGSAFSNGAPTDPGIFDFLRKHGIEVREQPTHTLHITHRKLMVVDGKTGFIGGMNCADEYHEVWHDVFSRVSGPAVGDMQGLFKEQWQRNGGSMPDTPPPAPIPGAGTARVVGHVGHRDTYLKQSYLAAIDTAKQSIRIADPYLTDTDVVSHLEAAARAGVRVQIVLPHVNDDATDQHIERSIYPDLLKAGVEIYEYSGRPMAHDKVATFDGQIATIGSSNLDNRSMTYNDEANIWSTDPETVQIMERNLFDADIRQSTRITKYRPTFQDKLALWRRPIQ